jgi:flagellar motor switch protein FliN
VREQTLYKNISESEKVFEALALPLESGLSAAFSSLAGATVPSRCIRMEKTSLRALLQALAAASCAFEVRYQSGLTGSLLLVCRAADLSSLNGKVSGTATKEDGALTPEIIETCLRFFTQVIQETNALFSARHFEVGSNSPELINPDGDTASLDPLGPAYEDALCATYQVSIGPGQDCPFHLLVDMQLRESLVLLLPGYKADAQSPEAESNKPVVPEPSRNRGGAQAKDSKSAKAVQTVPDKPPANWNIDLLLDVELPITVSFGECEMPLRDVLKLTAGSVIELDKSVNDPVTIIVNQKPIARGEVVMVDGNYGVRITEVESTADRIRSFA